MQIALFRDFLIPQVSFIYILFSFSLFQCSPSGQPDGERISLTFIILFFTCTPSSPLPPSHTLGNAKKAPESTRNGVFLVLFILQ
jgi:hypothetical protein